MTSCHQVTSLAFCIVKHWCALQSTRTEFRSWLNSIECIHHKELCKSRGSLLSHCRSLLSRLLVTQLKAGAGQAVLKPSSVFAVPLAIPSVFNLWSPKIVYTLFSLLCSGSFIPSVFFLFLQIVISLVWIFNWNQNWMLGSLFIVPRDCLIRNSPPKSWN